MAPGNWPSAWRMAGTIGSVMVPDSVTTTRAPAGIEETSTAGREPAADCDSSAQQASGTSTTKMSPSSNQSRAVSMRQSLVRYGPVGSGG
ncbi:hypothetical protein GCM10025789_25740 [Tessaracoccus lubricantis]|uniref:Uncharacterized protein n=1 Tax=Tessaracoccus lubricantis TaxID=545543 RepID=A0ABP9FJC9_9ACTN